MENRQEKLKSFFEDALAIESVEHREDFLRRECSETALRHEVEELLQQHLKMDDSFLEHPTRDGLSDDNQAVSMVGTRVGAYKLLEVIGDGGMGTVFMAEQESPVRRIVALKIIKAGMDSKEVIARFESERQVMAIMNHKNISRIFEAGTTQSGRPYFVMELVKGKPVNRFCQQHRLGTREIVQLFGEICEAVQHAHQKGIIHRDLKPGNIMVELHDVEYVPKIIDFGVAKATNQKLTEQTLFTRFSQIVGTPAYMSPEQAELSGLDVDTRSDVYSLGIVLYELLAGLPPFDRGEIHKVGYDEMRRIIREEVPPKPSDRISTLKAGLTSTRQDNRGRSIGQLKTELRGDLDWIVMKALEKDRRRRYQSARELGEDLQRYLNREPVKACPPSVLYQLSKFANRHRAMLTACLLIGISIVGGLIATSIEAYRANSAEQLAQQRWQAEKIARVQADDARRQANLEAERADQEAALAKAVSSFLQQDLLGLISRETQINVGLVPDPEIQLVSVLDRASQNIAGRFDSSPLVEGSIRYTIGSAYQSLGLYKKAEPHLELAVDLGRQFASGNQLGLSRAIGALGSLRVAQGRFPEAESLLLESHEIVLLHAEKDSRELLESMNALIVLRFEQQRYQEARKLSAELLDICRENFGVEDPVTLSALSNLASQLGPLGEDAESEKIFREVYDIRERTLGPDHPDTLSSQNSLAVAMNSRGHHSESQRLFEEVVRRSVDIHGPDHPSTLLAQANLGHVLEMQLKHDEAEVVLVDTLATIEETLNPNSPLASSTQSFLAAVYESQGRLDQANELRQISNRADLERLGEQAVQSIGSMSNAAWILQQTGQSRDAELEFLKVIDLARRQLGAQHDVTLTIRNNLGVAYQQSGRFRDARRLLEDVLWQRRKADGRDHVRSLNVEYNLAYVDVRLGSRSETIIQLEDLVPRMEQHLGIRHPKTLMTLLLLGDAIAGTRSIEDRYPKAEHIYRQVFDRRVEELGLYHAKTIEAMRKLAEMMTKQGANDRASEFLQNQVATASKERGPEDSKTNLIREAADRVLANPTEDVLLESRLLEQFETVRARLGIDNKKTQESLLKLTGHHKSKRNFETAEDLIREQLDELRDIEKAQDQTNVVLVGQFPLLEMGLADVLIAKEQSQVEISESPEAIQILQALIDQSIEIDGAGTEQEMDARLKLGGLLEGRNQYAEALKQKEIRLEFYREKVGDEHQRTWMAMSAIYRNLAEQRRFAEAEAVLNNIIDYYRRQTGVSQNTARYQHSLVQIALAQGKLKVAEELCRKSLAEHQPSLPSDSQFMQNTDRTLALIYQLEGRPEKSESHLKSMLARFAAEKFEEDSHSMARTSLALAEVFSMQERFEESEEIARRVFELELRMGRKNRNVAVSAQRELAISLIGRKQFDEAQFVLRDILAYYDTAFPRSWKRFSAMSQLGECLLQNAEYQRAERLLLGAYQGLNNHLKVSAMSPSERQTLFMECTDGLIRLYTATSQPLEVQKWKVERERQLADVIQSSGEQ